MKNSKRGSSSVFIVIIMGTMFAIIFAMFMGARNEYAKSRADAIISLSGDSVLSEFNDYVQKEYGLFLVEGKKSQLTGKLEDYVKFSLDGMKEVDLKSVGVSGADYSAAHVDLIEAQIIEYMKYAEAIGIINDFMKPANETNDMKYETLRNGETIVSLPTYHMPKNSLTSIASQKASNSKNFEGLLNAGTDEYLTNRYILSHFNNMAYKVDDQHFFRNEVEYILGGELSDKQNEKRVEMAIEAIRFPLNLEHIVTDPKKMEALLAVAEVITPEAAPATQMLLAAAWAYAESDNDVELLWKGHKVPIVKDKSTWAISLENVIKGSDSGTFMPKTEKGQDYDDYLQFLLLFQDSDLRTARIMDLIQINTRMNSDRNFVIEEHCVGIHISAKVNNMKFNYEKKY